MSFSTVSNPSLEVVSLLDLAYAVSDETLSSPVKEDFLE